MILETLCKIHSTCMRISQDRHTGRQTRDRQAGRQADKQAKQASRRVGRQAGRQAGRQTGRHALSASSQCISTTLQYIMYNSASHRTGTNGHGDVGIMMVDIAAMPAEQVDEFQIPSHPQHCRDEATAASEIHLDQWIHGVLEDIPDHVDRSMRPTFRKELLGIMADRCHHSHTLPLRAEDDGLTLDHNRDEFKHNDTVCRQTSPLTSPLPPPLRTNDGAPAWATHSATHDRPREVEVLLGIMVASHQSPNSRRQLCGVRMSV
jgi:hypothetical protein